MSYYSDIEGDIRMVDEESVKQILEELNDYPTPDWFAGQEDILLIFISGYDNHLYNFVNEILQAWDDKIYSCEVYGHGEDGSHWRWMKRPNWDKIREQQGRVIYED